MKKMFFAMVVGILMISGCIGAMTNGTRQDIAFNSTPSVATLEIDEEVVGETPTVVSLSRKDTHTFRMFLDGYQEVTGVIQSRVDGGIVIADIFLTGLIGLAIDASGGMYALEPNVINVNLIPSISAEVVTLEE